MIISNPKVCHQITKKNYYLKNLAKIIKKFSKIFISFKEMV